MLLSRIYKISRIDFKYVHMEALQLLYCQKVCVKILKVKLETLQRIIRMGFLSSLSAEHEEQLEVNDEHECSQNEDKLTNAFKYCNNLLQAEGCFNKNIFYRNKFHCRGISNL
ncbi:uncharacterized protein LOC118444358 isoform X1 [Vespa mandarinia]|uniref:uncharacterized protein LOC118444358 isoform X1 n=1 Tax=Vespa mandarinia TaxID=7446 RepID=UPI00160A8943|nr:uncharacterized protein LOC118444358 isoform X1 [Vespa mandarinia]